MRCLLFLTAILCLTMESVAEFQIPKTCRQVICVTTPAWSSPTGSLQRWERADAGAPWTMTGAPVAVVVGEHGLGWGLGLHHSPGGDAGPRKTEGDRRAPAGMFRLTETFGAGTDAVGRMPWRPIVPALEAVDDPKSRFYNRIVDRSRIEKPDWHSAERMARIPEYALGIVVAQNPQNVPGAGSCVFLHLRRGERIGTAGCTVLRKGDLLTVLQWLDPAREPVLIQLPRGVAQRELKSF